MAELLDIVDESGNPTGRTVEREKAHSEGILHRTAHLWLLGEKEGTVRVLLQKRSPEKSSYPGCWDISSAGHIPAGIDWRESAVRELKEELGIEAAPGELVLCGIRKVILDDCFGGIPFHDRQISAMYFLPFDPDRNDFVLQKEEVECVQWYDFDEAVHAVRENRIHHCIFPGELDTVKAAYDRWRREIRE